MVAEVATLKQRRCAAIRQRDVRLEGVREARLRRLALAGLVAPAAALQHWTHKVAHLAPLQAVSAGQRRRKRQRYGLGCRRCEAVGGAFALGRAQNQLRPRGDCGGQAQQRLPRVLRLQVLPSSTWVPCARLDAHCELQLLLQPCGERGPVRLLVRSLVGLTNTAAPELRAPHAAAPNVHQGRAASMSAQAAAAAAAWRLRRTRPAALGASKFAPRAPRLTAAASRRFRGALHGGLRARSTSGGTALHGAGRSSKSWVGTNGDRPRFQRRCSCAGSAPLQRRAKRQRVTWLQS